MTNRHGPYELVHSTIANGLIIRRLDPDGAKRVVAFIDTRAHWARFVAALNSGADEVAAVRAIDS